MPNRFFCGKLYAQNLFLLAYLELHLRLIIIWKIQNHLKVREHSET